MIKISFWVIALSITIVTSLQVFFVYYNNIKVEGAFEGAANNLSSLSTLEMKNRLPNLFIIAQVHLEDLPEEFFENLVVKKESDKFKLSSEYQVVVWVLGEPDMVNVDEVEEELNVSLIEKLRRIARIDFYFSPYAETP